MLRISDPHPANTRSSEFPERVLPSTQLIEPLSFVAFTALYDGSTSTELIALERAYSPGQRHGASTLMSPDVFVTVNIYV